MAKPVVYVLHGLLGTAYAHFGHQIRVWSEGCDVVPVDLPGHGRCRLDARADYLQGAYRYAEALIERFGPGRLVAASYLGGPLAVRCAAERPDLVESLALTGFAPGLARSVFLTWLAGFQRLADQNPVLAAEYDRLHAGRWRDTLDAYSADAEKAYEARFLVTASALGALEPPLLLANGSLKSAERAAAEAASNPGSGIRGRVIDGAGHIASHDAPEEFNRAVSEFWAEFHPEGAERS